MTDWFHRATSHGETGALAQSIDWARTPLGAPETWGPALRNAVETCLTTRFAMLVLWGPDLIKIYNDAYRDMLGDKHPAAMGSPARDVWPEIWDVIGPQFAEVLRTGEPTLEVDQLLVMNRSGFAEETHFTYSYSPLRDEEEIVGILDTAVETTEQVVARRRLGCISMLAATLQGAEGDVEVVSRMAVDIMAADQPDIVAADIHLCRGDVVQLVATTRESPAALALALDREVVLRVLASGTATMVGPAMVLPFRGGPDHGVGTVTLEPNPRRPFDEGYRAFFSLVASLIQTAVDDALRRRHESDEFRRVTESLQRALLPVVAASPRAAVRYQPAARGLSVGGDWYDVVDLGEGRTAILVGDCVGSGLDAAATMGQLRSATRALLLDRHGPASTITSLDRYARSIEGAEATTVLCGIVDAPRGVFTYASAGHPPALLVRGGTAHWLDEARHVPLATFDVGPCPQCEIRLEAPDTLFLYTDGLIERRGEHLDLGLERLAAAATAAGGLAVEAVADSVLATLLPDGADDDVALLVHRLSSPAA